MGAGAHARIGAHEAKCVGELAREPVGAAVDDDVELAGRVAEQQIARGAADQLDVASAGCHPQQLGAAGKLAHALQHSRAGVGRCL